MSQKCDDEGFVGVHIGAGQHSEARTRLYLDICAAACQAGVDVLRDGGSALDAAERATLVLEDAGETNAGFGSNLTEAGTLEMDAGLMDGSTLLFGAVGAITEIKNPITVARKLVDEQAKGLLPLGRVPPGFLVGEGARDWAKKRGLQAVSSEHLISEKAAKLYKHYKKKLDAYKLSLEQNKRKKEDTCEITCKKLRTAQKITISEHVRSNDGATKLVDGNSIDFEESTQVLRRQEDLTLVNSNVQSLCSGEPNQRISLPGCSYSQLPSERSMELNQSLSVHHAFLDLDLSNLPGSSPLLHNTLPTNFHTHSSLPAAAVGSVEGSGRLAGHLVPATVSALSKFTHNIPDDYVSSAGHSSDGSLDVRHTVNTAEPTPEYDDQVHDTVGVVVLDRHGNVAASVSSGGIALKQSGRVGQASCYGCGCWAQRALKPDSSSVAVSTTGCGEHLVRTLLARECGQGLAKSTTPMETLQKIMKEKFAESEFLEGINEKLGGAICMQFNKNTGKGNFLWTHTTASMGIGFQTTRENKATVKMSRLPKQSSNQGTTILVESVKFDTRRDCI